MTAKPTREQVTAAAGVELCRYVERCCFGDDLTANTDEQIRTDRPATRLVVAVALWLKQNRSIVFDSIRFPHCYPKGVWHNREGQPWQADLEAHVESWRAEPRDFIGDGNMLNELKAEILERFDIFWITAMRGKVGETFEVEIGNSSVELMSVTHSGESSAPTEARASCEAAVLACMESEGE